MSAFIRYLAESGLCLVLFYAAYWFLMRKETTFVLNRLYLLGSILLSLTIPLMKVPSPFRIVALSSEPLDLAPLTAPAKKLSALFAMGDPSSTVDTDAGVWGGLRDSEGEIQNLLEEYRADGKFKEISVKVKGQSYRVTNRSGYFAN